MIYESFHVQPPPARRSSGSFLLIPPISGLRPPVDASYAMVAAALAEQGYAATALEFGGQNSRPGLFSVKNSCALLTSYVHTLAAQNRTPMFLFGICSGALAAACAARTHQVVTSVFCWEMSPYYRYSRAAAAVLSRKFGLRFDQDTFFEEVQPAELLRDLRQPVAFAFSSGSDATTPREQEALARLTPQGVVVRVESAGHFLDRPAGAARAVADRLVAWSEEFLQVEGMSR